MSPCPFPGPGGKLAAVCVPRPEDRDCRIAVPLSVLQLPPARVQSGDPRPQQLLRRRRLLLLLLWRRLQL